MRGDIPKQVARLAQSQHGLVTLGQAGVDADRAEQWIRSGRLARVHRGVYALAGTPRTFERAVLAACAAAGSGAAAWGPTAAQLHAFGLQPAGRVHVVVPRGRRSRVGGVSVHESAAFEPADATTVHGIPVTTPARTLVDLAPRLDAAALERLLDDLLRRGVVGRSALRWQLDRSPSRGLGPLRELVDARRPGRVRTRDSDLEDSFAGLLDVAGVAEPIAQFRVRLRGKVLGRVDFAYPEVRVGVEVDGGQHLTVSQLRADRARQNRIQALDWLLLRFGRDDVERNGPATCAELARTLASRALAMRVRVPRTRGPRVSAAGMTVRSRTEH